jgi:hypothetical protein
MINTPTVVILGAGASEEYGFPVGSTLIQDILIDYINPKHKKHVALICELDKWRYPDIGHIEYCPDEQSSYTVTHYPIVKPKDSFVDEFISTLKKSQTASIDDFLYHHGKYRLIGKVSILLNLIRKERSYKQEEYGWYSYLWRLLYQGTGGDIKKILKNRIKIITFNYERSIEQFLHMALSNMFSIDEPKIVDEVLNQIEVYHVYGRLGRLPWQDIELPVCDFGENLEKGNHLGVIKAGKEFGQIELTKEAFDQCKHVLAIAKSVKTYHEGQDITATYQKVISDAERVYFLGFGFNQQNMQALGLTEKILNTKVYATTYGLGNKEAFNIKEHLVSLGAQITQPAGLDNVLWSERHQYNKMKILEYFKEVAPLE